MFIMVYVMRVIGCLWVVWSLGVLFIFLLVICVFSLVVYNRVFYLVFILFVLFIFFRLGIRLL